MPDNEKRWFQRFPVESDDRADPPTIWDDVYPGYEPVRQPTRAEKLSIVLIGASAIGFIVLMLVTLLVAVYISSR